MTLASVADIRAARTRSASWVATTSPQTTGGTWRFVQLDNTDPFSTPATSAGESPTSLMGEPALEGSGLITRLHNIVGKSLWTSMFDVLWVSQLIDASVAGTFTIGSSALPARDVDGSSNGRGCVIAIYAGNSTPTATVNYTNSAGVSGQSAPTSQNARSTYNVLPLAAGDEGVRSIESVTITGVSASTTFRLLVMRHVGRFVNLPTLQGTPRAGVLERVHAGTVLLPTYTPALSTGGPSIVRADIALG